jgi:hypothetical protein
MPGVYRSKAEGSFSGYRSTLMNTDIYGKPQLTCSIHLDYISRLFELLYKHSDNYEEVAYSLENAAKYMNLLQKYNLPTREYNQLYGFMLYLLHFFEIYKYYKEYIIQQGDGPIKYFKSMFSFKPRTNPASLYNTLTVTQRNSLKKMVDEIRNNPDEYDTYVISMMDNMNEKKCVYTKNLKGVPNGMYNYDNEDLETYLGLQEFKRFIKMDVPCINPYDPGHTFDSELSTLVYLNEDVFEVDHSSQVWEWPTDIRSISYEFRDMSDLLLTSLRMMGEEENTHFNHYFERDMISPIELKEMINIIFHQFFETLFNRGKVSKKISSKKKPKSKSNKKCPEHKVYDRKSKNCRDRKICQKGSVRDKKTGLCKSKSKSRSSSKSSSKSRSRSRSKSAKRSKTKCTGDKVYDRKINKCRDRKICQKGTSRDKKTGLCKSK